MVHSYSVQVWQLLIKLIMELPFDLAISFLGIYPREMNSCSHKNLYKNVQRGFIHICSKLGMIPMSFNVGNKL